MGESSKFCSRELVTTSLSVQPYSLYSVVFVPLDAGERSFRKNEEKTHMKFSE